MIRPLGGRQVRQSGFSLIEVMLTVGLFALIAGVATVSMRSGLDAAGVRSESAALRALLTDARTAAIVARAPVTVAIDPVRRRIDVGHASIAGRVLPTGIVLDAGTGDQPLRIVFYPDGSTTGGAFAISAAGRRLVLTVNWLTGRVDVAASVGGQS